MSDPSSPKPVVVCVPVEPTREMLEAYSRTCIERIRQGLQGVENIAPFTENIKVTYAAMLAAAPQSTHIAVERELLERWELRLTSLDEYLEELDRSSRSLAEVLASLRAILSLKR